MKLNYIPEWPTYTPEQIAKCNNYIDMLCALIQQSAYRIFTCAIERQTANESADALVDEARSVLLDVLAELGDSLQINEESQRLKEALMTALAQEPEIFNMDIEHEWIERRSKDLARAIVGFWVNQTEAETFFKVTETSRQFLYNMLIEYEPRLVEEFKLICSRFWLDWDEAIFLLFECHNAATSEVLSDKDFLKSREVAKKRA
jgi:hypothetical protein